MSCDLLLNNNSADVGWVEERNPTFSKVCWVSPPYGTLFAFVQPNLHLFFSPQSDTSKVEAKHLPKEKMSYYNITKYYLVKQD
ncbi:hypothetical protein [Nostoc sp.]|uniref:hypothetical protein n=1 Tax=Nostoc sp. TaxID=1180 RepID=UPI002FF9CED3